MTKPPSLPPPRLALDAFARFPSPFAWLLEEGTEAAQGKHLASTEDRDAYLAVERARKAATPAALLDCLRWFLAGRKVPSTQARGLPAFVEVLLLDVGDGEMFPGTGQEVDRFQAAEEILVSLRNDRRVPEFVWLVPYLEALHELRHPEGLPQRAVRFAGQALKEARRRRGVDRQTELALFRLLGQAEAAFDGTLKPEAARAAILDKEFYTSEDIGRILRRSESTARRLMREGKIPSRKIGRVWLCHRDAFRKFLEGSPAPSPSPASPPTSASPAPPRSAEREPRSAATPSEVKRALESWRRSGSARSSGRGKKPARGGDSGT